MSRISTIQYKGKDILIEDFSNMRPGPEFTETLALAQKTIAANPPHSVLAIFDASGSSFNTEMLTAMKNFVQANKPYIKSAAVVGIKGLLNIALTTVSNISNRSFNTFEDRQKALDFLVNQ